MDRRSLIKNAGIAGVLATGIAPAMPAFLMSERRSMDGYSCYLVRRMMQWRLHDCLQDAGASRQCLYLRQKGFRKKPHSVRLFHYSFCACMKRSKVASVKRNHRFWSERNLE